MKPFKLNNKLNFIAGWYINPKVCDGMINYFEKTNKNKQKGSVCKNGETTVDKFIKDSIDLPINPKLVDKAPLDYLNELEKVCELYLDKYDWATSNQERWKIVENFNIQKYPLNGGYKIWHTERNGTKAKINRHLVFSTYLNDVKNKGETEFYYQKLKIKPKKGLTLIWPADWTFTHRGIPAPKEKKYIATGWYSYV
jgi:hypothetical protein|tara:strand:- start:303 stop:893 length:591 start_codon:yes stop_codon:yes gene_type:complete